MGESHNKLVFGSNKDVFPSVTLVNTSLCWVSIMLSLNINKVFFCKNIVFTYNFKYFSLNPSKSL